jgi:hypothetical protein
MTQTQTSPRNPSAEIRMSEKAKADLMAASGLCLPETVHVTVSFTDEDPPGLDLSQPVEHPDFCLLGSYAPATRAIKVYRLAVEKVASEQDCSAEDLARLVLIHEWAHAFTHLAQMGEGDSGALPGWSGAGFEGMDEYTCEHFAQFYVHHTVCDEDELNALFRNLMNRQSAPYRIASEVDSNGSMAALNQALAHARMWPEPRARSGEDHSPEWWNRIWETPEKLVEARTLASPALTSWEGDVADLIESVAGNPIATRELFDLRNDWKRVDIMPFLMSDDPAVRDDTRRFLGETSFQVDPK